jgi:hypothetical protein
MSETRVEYFRKREMAERAAAKRATSRPARSVHQELAQAYSRLTSGKPGSTNG